MIMKEVEYQEPSNSNINIFLWGREGVGKTYLSATMPKPCLYLTFDSNALNGVNDLIKDGTIKKEDLPKIRFDEGDYKEIGNAYKKPGNPFGLNELYEKLKFKTVVFDSISSFFKLALQYGVEYANMTEKEKVTIERPGFAGYGVRSVATKETVFNLINWCNRHDVNCVVIGHEGEMQKDDATGLTYRSVQLSGDIATEIARWFDECWFLSPSQAGERTLVVKPRANARPIKSRMFSDEVQFVPADNLNLSLLLDAWQEKGKVNTQAIETLGKGK